MVLVPVLSPLIRTVTSRNQDLWVFGSSSSKHFTENSKYLYLHASKNLDGVEAVWVSENEEIIEFLRENDLEAYHARSSSGIRKLLNAGTVFYSHHTTDLGRWWWCCLGATIINLCHGNPIKEVQRKPWGAFTGRADYAAVTGEEPKQFFATVPGMPSEFGERALVTGYPRDDPLTGDSERPLNIHQDLHTELTDLSDDNDLILYTPTWRPYRDSNPLFTADQELSDLAQTLEENDSYLLVKAHPVNDPPEELAELSRVVLLPPGFDLYPLLRDVSMLVTDYSSIYYDFLLLDKPTLLFAYDRERYAREKGIYVDYDELGPIVDDLESLLGAFEGLTAGDLSPPSNRDEILERFYRHTDGSASRRICDRVRGLQTSEGRPSETTSVRGDVRPISDKSDD